MPPTSVTMHAVYLGAALAPPLLPVFSSGAAPQPAAARVNPPAARAAMIRFPRTGRKPVSFPRRATCWRRVPSADCNPGPAHLRGFGPDCWLTVTGDDVLSASGCWERVHR